MSNEANNNSEKKNSDESSEEKNPGSQRHPGSGINAAAQETTKEQREKLIKREAPFPGGPEEAAGTKASKNNKTETEYTQIGAPPSVGDESPEDKK